MKSKVKFIISIGVGFALIVTLVVVYNISISQYNSTLERMIYASRLDVAVVQETTNIWRFLAGDGQGADGYAEVHEKIKELDRELLEKGDDPQLVKIRALIEREREIFGKLYSENGEFFKEIQEARAGFIEKNNKHIRRTLGYLNGWVVPGTQKEVDTLAILEGIRKERILFEEFDPNSPSVDDLMAEFRETNNNVVAGLVKLWLEELETGMRKVSSPEFRKKLEASHKIVGQITATSFPSVSEEDAALFGITPNKDTLLGADADNATKAFSTSCENNLDEYEKGVERVVWSRADVSDVGENVTPTLTLAKIISCQQGLRANAEDVFRWHLFYANEVEPELLLIQTDADDFRNDISSLVQELARRVFFATIFVSLFLLLLMVIFIRATIALHKTKDNLQNSLREANKLATIIEKSFEGVMVVGHPEHIYLYVNRAWEHITGWSREEVIGKENPRLLKSGKHDQVFYKKIWDTILAGDIFMSEITNKKKDGTFYTVDITIIPIKDEKGNITSFAEVTRDITNKKEHEQELNARTFELERINKLMVGREMKMVELKRALAEKEQELEAIKKRSGPAV